MLVTFEVAVVAVAVVFAGDGVLGADLVGCGMPISIHRRSGVEYEYGCVDLVGVSLMGETEKSSGGSVNSMGGCELFHCDVCSKLGRPASLAASARVLIWLTTRLQ